MTDRDALAALKVIVHSVNYPDCADPYCTEGDYHDDGALAEAILAAGWRAPECEHVWMAVRLDQTQPCSLCGESRRHTCTFNCPAPHVVPSDEDAAAFRQVIERARSEAQ